MNVWNLRMATLVLAVGLSGTAQAALQGRDLNGSGDSFEGYYDTELNITWLADANYAKTSGYDADGKMTWAAANTWAANLSFTDGVNVYNNWRLPTTLQPDASCGGQSGGSSYGYGCAGSEMGHLFYIELGGVANRSITTIHNANYNLFSNVKSGAYWSGSMLDASLAWYFGMSYGNQYADAKGIDDFVWAVSPGDVGIAAVPEADTWAMLLAGLGLVGVATRRRKLVKV
jgi:hypothetical protein